MPSEAQTQFVNDDFWKGFRFAELFFAALTGKPFLFRAKLNLFKELADGTTTVDPTPEEAVADFERSGVRLTPEMRRIVMEKYSGPMRRDTADEYQQRAKQFLQVFPDPLGNK